jgi:hypothetical protein
MYTNVGPTYTHSGANSLSVLIATSPIHPWIHAQHSYSSLLTNFCTSRPVNFIGPTFSLNGPFSFSLSQAANICPHQQLTLSFWLSWVTPPLQLCSLLVCIGTQCNIFDVLMGGFVQYSFLGPVPDGSTSVSISVSVDVASTCTGQMLLFDDFKLE